jgi:hypothetical protein
MTNINAFHPDFVKTHMPQFMSDIKTNSRQAGAGATLSKHVTKKRETTPSHGTVYGMSKVTRESSNLTPNQLHEFPKTKKVQKGWQRTKEREMTMEEIKEDLSAMQRAKMASKEFHTLTKPVASKEKK